MDFFTSESVSEGHPDKVCDQISDAILDAYLAEDSESRVACETLAKDNQVIIAGEIRSEGNPDIDKVIRETIVQLGYNNDDLGFNGNTCEISKLISVQSPDIAQGVDENSGEDKNQGAGDQGIIFGYACRETEKLMPAPIEFSHKLMKRQADLRKSKEIDWLRPDAKSQVTFAYENGAPKWAKTIVFSTQHEEGVSPNEIEKTIMEKVISPVLSDFIREDTRIYVNPTGKFVIGGPAGDCGLTGRKIIVDTYGGAARHGGGAFSGKDPSKVDRSAAYALRYLAKNVVFAGLADICEIQVSYAIGISKPTSVYLNTFGTAKIPVEEIKNLIERDFDLSPYVLIESLNLKKPIYNKTAAYGHFGREENGFTWEETHLGEAWKNE